MNSRVRIAIAGAIVVGVVAALVALQSGAVSGQPGSAATLTSGQNGGNGLAQGASGTQGAQTQTPSGGHPSTATATIAAPPTRAPVPTATPRPCYTPTPPPVSTPPTSVTLHGDVTSNPSNSSFQFQFACGTTITITVDGNTTYSNSQVTNIGAVQSGEQGRIAGSYQPDGTFLATNVNLFIDN